MESTNATAAEFAAAREATGPADITLWQMLRGYRSDPLVRWTEIRRAHGDVARYRFVGRDTYFVSSAEGARRVLQENAGNYTKEHASYAMLRRLFGNGLFTSEGEFWLRQRRLAQPAFHRQRIAAMANLMADAAEDAARDWERAAASGATVLLLREMSRVTLRIVGDALFGTGLSPMAAPVGEAWDVLSAQLVERFRTRRALPPVLPTAYDRNFRRARATLFGVVDQIIARRRALGGGGGDLLSMFMEARDEETGERMSDAQLRDEVVTMLLAGHESTAVALAWTWVLLDRHPAAAQRLRAELDSVLAGRAPGADDYARLPYTRAVVEESLRLRPPAYIVNRHVRRDDVVCGRRVYAGGAVVISPMILHRHPDYWDRPEEFVPERWLDREAEKRRPKFAFVPFSAGPRQCIGNGFAMMEAVVILATLAQRFDVRLAPGYEPAPEYLVLARPASGAPATLRARAAAAAPEGRTAAG
jgi:cytochrome P450